MPPAGDRYRSLRKAAGDDGSKKDAERRRAELVIVPTPTAIEELQWNTKGTNAILHVTC